MINPVVRIMYSSICRTQLYPPPSPKPSWTRTQSTLRTGANWVLCSCCTWGYLEVFASPLCTRVRQKCMSPSCTQVVWNWFVWICGLWCNKYPHLGPYEQSPTSYADTLDDIVVIHWRLCPFFCALEVVLPLAWQNRCLLRGYFSLLSAPDRQIALNYGAFSWWHAGKAAHISLKKALSRSPAFLRTHKVDVLFIHSSRYNR